MQASAVVRENNDGKSVIIVTGGCGENGEYLNDCEMYDILADKWDPFPNMKEKRAAHQDTHS